VAVTADVQALPPCNYQITPAMLDFGVVSPPSVQELSFSVTNLGVNAGETCVLSALDLLPGSDQTFALSDGPIDQLELQPGESKRVRVRATAAVNGSL